MHDNLVSYINNHLQEKLNQESIDVIKEEFNYKKLKRNQFFLQEGDVCKKVGFILKGAMKKYTIDDSGKENIIGLYIENWWVSDRESIFTKDKSQFYIDAVEPTELLVISSESIEHRLNKLPSFRMLNNALLERQTYHLMRRILASNTLSAEKRLKQLEKDYPEFFQRFSQRIIASYLGMSKETLSRIRSSAVS